MYSYYIPPPIHHSPAYQQRQDRRQAVRTAAENVQAQPGQVSEEPVIEIAGDAVAEEATALPVMDQNVIEAEQALNNFS